MGIWMISARFKYNGACYQIGTAPNVVVDLVKTLQKSTPRATAEVGAPFIGCRRYAICSPKMFWKSVVKHPASMLFWLNCANDCLAMVLDAPGQFS
jgi:hypothetical protein